MDGLELTGVDSLSELEGRIVRSLTVTGFHKTKPYILEREFETTVGRPFSYETFQRDLFRLENLGVVSSVDLKIDADSAGVDIEATVTEMPWLVPYPMISYNEQNGWSVGAGMASLNLAGRAIRLSGSVLIGGVNNLSGLLSWPWITGNRVSLNARLAHIERLDKLNEFNETSNELAPVVGSWIGRSGRVAAHFSWFQMRSDRDGITVEPNNIDDWSSFGLSLGLDTRTSYRDPHHGWWNEALLMRTDLVGASKNYWTAILDLRRYQPVGDKTRFMLGALTSLRSGTPGVDVPQYLLYRMGGANSIRGYDIEELGRVLVGKNEMIYTVELQHTLVPIREYSFLKWSVSLGLQVALLADAGIAWNTADEFNWDNSKLGTGIGIRLLIPGADVLRLDLAMGENGKIYLHLGSQSKLVAQRRRIR
jgi:outer membrane protein assembly factor BamA